jgi:hypothetical protein
MKGNLDKTLAERKGNRNRFGVGKGSHWPITLGRKKEADEVATALRPEIDKIWHLLGATAFSL